MKKEVRIIVAGSVCGASAFSAYEFFTIAKLVRPDPLDMYPIPHTPISIDYQTLQLSLYGLSVLSAAVAIGVPFFLLRKNPRQRSR